jgi:hypothetical protein
LSTAQWVLGASSLPTNWSHCTHKRNLANNTEGGGGGGELTMCIRNFNLQTSKIWKRRKLFP